MKKILLFDIDGTLLLTGGAGKIAFEKAFHELFGIANSWGETNPHGKTDPMIFEEIALRVLKRPVSRDENSMLVERYLYHFRKEIKRSPNFRLMPGIPSLLQTLSKEKNLILGIATGNLEEAGWLKLERGGLRDFFPFGGFGSDSSERSKIILTAIKRAEKTSGQKANLDQVYIIGDTHYDVRAAKKVGLKSIGVVNESVNNEETFGNEKPTHLLTDLSNTGLFLKLIN